jgi:hypothetical protein
MIRETVLCGALLLAALFSGPLYAAPAPPENGPSAPVGPAPASQEPPKASTAPAQPLDVTITGELHDEIPVVKAPPSLDVPFRDVITFSRDGQTEAILAEEVRYMSPEDHNRLIEMHSQQTASPAPVLIPAPPFFRMEVPSEAATLLSGGTSGGAAPEWEFQVVDQNNRVVKSLSGRSAPSTFFEWDGYEGGVIALKAGPAYSPLLLVKDAEGRTHRFFGEAVQMDALQYEQDGLLHIEISNDRLYERGSAAFADEIKPVLDGMLDVVRLRVGTPLRVVIYETPAGGPSLAQQRTKTWKDYLVDKLMITPDDVTVATAPDGERGGVTSVMMLAKP